MCARNQIKRRRPSRRSQADKEDPLLRSVLALKEIGSATWKPAVTSLMIGLVLILPLVSTEARARPLVFLSTQLTPFEEAVKMRSILKGFGREVDFQPCDDRQVFEERLKECVAGTTKIDIIGALHGDFSHLAEAGFLWDVNDILARLRDRGIVDDFISLGKLGRQNQYYIPWMQATYIWVANRRALEHLPKGAHQDRLSYDDLKTWAVNMQNATGEAKLGFPVEGLMHRFLQGYLYPSYMGSTLRKFGGSEAEGMWLAFRDLWRCVNRCSLWSTKMDKPLLADEVWVAWDHTARIVEALERQPNEFDAFPAPSGRKGRGFMLGLVGLAIPKCVQDREGAEELIEYLTRPEVQKETLRNLFFFPVLSLGGNEGLSYGLRQLNEAVYKQATARDAVKALLPMGLGKRDTEFNMAYNVAFSRIVLRGREDIKSELARQTAILRGILSDTQARCWPPDEPSDGPCPVE